MVPAAVMLSAELRAGLCRVLTATDLCCCVLRRLPVTDLS